MDEMLIAMKIRVKGRVQGVFFRANTLKEAARCEVRGWVRNCDDGSVEIFAEGTRQQIGELLKWCGKGPSAARVDSVDYQPVPVHGYLDFRVLG